MENLIQAKGFDECMVYYDTDRVDIVVKTDGLTDDEVMQMRDIAIRETSVPVENISIVEINNWIQDTDGEGHFPSVFL